MAYPHIQDDAVSFYIGELRAIATLMENLGEIFDHTEISIGNIEVYDTNANIIGQVVQDGVTSQFFPAKSLSILGGSDECVSITQTSKECSR